MQPSLGQVNTASTVVKAGYNRRMKPEENQFLKAFFNAVSDRPLEPDDERYVPLYGEDLADADPVQQLAQAVEWSTESVRLFSGYRGAGKSTELRRLKGQLEESGHLVFLCDLEDYLNLSTPVDVSDFLMAVAGSFDDAIRAEHEDALGSLKSYWEEAAGFLTGLKIKDVSVSAAGFKASLKSDPTFNERLQKTMAEHLGALVKDVREFCVSRVAALRAHTNEPDRNVVLLLDSIEHIRGTFANATDVQSSVETLFAGHAEKLRIPDMHVIYTVPPYLKVRYPSIGELYDGLEILPSFRLSERDGTPIESAYRVFEQVVEKRGDWRQLLGQDRSTLDRLIRSSGGHLRHLLRLLANIALRARTLPAPERAVAAAIGERKAQFLPIPHEDARWLATICHTHQADPQRLQEYPYWPRFFDTHLVLCYRNGDEWYDVHPLIKEQVRKQAARLDPATPVRVA